jgi:hypothetical protein
VHLTANLANIFSRTALDSHYLFLVTNATPCSTCGELSCASQSLMYSSEYHFVWLSTIDNPTSVFVNYSTCIPTTESVNATHVYILSFFNCALIVANYTDTPREQPVSEQIIQFPQRLNTRYLPTTGCVYMTRPSPMFATLMRAPRLNGR